MKLKVSTIKRSLNEKNYQKELFMCKLKHWFESMNPFELTQYLEIDLMGLNYNEVVKCTMDRYAEKLFEYMKKNKEVPLRVEGKDKEHKDLFNIKIEVFDYAGVCLDVDIRETFYDEAIVAVYKELWLLENGDFVVSQCVRYESCDTFVEYRNLDYKLEDFYDTGIDVADFFSYLKSIV